MSFQNYRVRPVRRESRPTAGPRETILAEPNTRMIVMIHPYIQGIVRMSNLLKNRRTIGLTDDWLSPTQTISFPAKYFWAWEDFSFSPLDGIAMAELLFESSFVLLDFVNTRWNCSLPNLAAWVMDRVNVRDNNYNVCKIGRPLTN